MCKNELEYKIKVYYSTGNSLHSEDTSDHVEYSWKSLNCAKENLKRIKEHYEMYQQLNGYRNDLTKDQILNKNKNKPWFVYQPKPFNKETGCAIDEKDKKKLGKSGWEYRPDEYYAELNINLITDDNCSLQIHAFWCGYFERLHSAEIEINKDDLKIKF